MNAPLTPCYPIYLKLRGQPVLVIGAGPVALRRIERLLEAGASVTVVSPRAVSEVRALRDAGRVAWKERPYEAADLEGPVLVLEATGDRALAREVRGSAEALGLLFNSAGDESLGDFHLPAVADRGDLRIAVSTGGASPTAAARIRDAVASWLDASASAVEEAVAQGRSPAACRGKVWLVGAGPGDPGLLTLRALELIATADVVFHDRLVSAAILRLIPERVEKVYVGKEAGTPGRADTAALLVESARRGRRVIRLKGGDPLVFGRGGEEMLALFREGIEYEVVPGISALNGVPAAAGIPVTLRGVANEIVVRSGHGCDAAPCRERHGAQTHVYFMAAARIQEVVAELLAEGLPASTPVAVIQRGTLPGERVLVGTLSDIGELAAREGVESPALLVAGRVVKFRETEQLLALLAAGAQEGGMP